MTEPAPSIRADMRRVATRAAFVGAALALICPHLPAAIQTPCAAVRAIVQICTLGAHP